MPQVGEPICVGTIGPLNLITLITFISKIKFESGIPIVDVLDGGATADVPPAGAAHWTPFSNYPAVYVRQGGKGETKDVKVDVEWVQISHDGAAKLKGVSADGRIVIEGDFTISGAMGMATVSCQFTKKPDFVANYGAGEIFEWTVTAGGDTGTAIGGGLLKLFFVDAAPLPINWGYHRYYLKVIDWATAWAQGAAGESQVLESIWDEFSDGTEARNPHATGFAYWQTEGCIQDLYSLVRPDGGAPQLGWSCKAIAHLFMECLALNGIKCQEVIINAAPGSDCFLVHNWDVRATPIPNIGNRPDLFYAGSWRHSDFPPLNTRSGTRFLKTDAAGRVTGPMEIDMLKRPGVPAQGQGSAPLIFGNHWIVLVGGKLYDTSYGAVHKNSMTAYARASLAGWRITTWREPASPTPGLPQPVATAWITEGIAKRRLVRQDGYQN